MSMTVTASVHLPADNDAADPDPKIVGKRLQADCWTLDIGTELAIFVHTPAQAFALRDAAETILDGMLAKPGVVS